MNSSASWRIEMAGKSPTELIRELQLEVAKLISELNGLSDEVRKADLLGARDRLTKLEASLNTLDVPSVLVQLGVIQEQLTELKKWPRDESAGDAGRVALRW